jgi:D-inositol-3-phosphate glycosyltransferase
VRLDALLGLVPHAAAARLAIVVLGGHATGRGELAGVPLYRAGYVHDVPHALAGLDLLLHPGGAEGMGTAVVEAMALGIPTVAFATGGLGEIIEGGVNGVLVPAADLPAFARATGDLVTDATVRAALGRAGPARAKRFSPEAMVDTIEAAYRDVLERSAV